MAGQGGVALSRVGVVQCTGRAPALCTGGRLAGVAATFARRPTACVTPLLPPRCAAPALEPPRGLKRRAEKQVRGWRLSPLRTLKRV